MRIAIGLLLTLGGAIGTIIVVPYAFIVGIMSGFADDQKMTLFYCIAAPIITIGSFVIGILVLQHSNQKEIEKKMSLTKR